MLTTQPPLSVTGYIEPSASAGTCSWQASMFRDALNSLSSHPPPQPHNYCELYAMDLTISLLCDYCLSFPYRFAIEDTANLLISLNWMLCLNFCYPFNWFPLFNFSLFHCYNQIPNIFLIFLSIATLSIHVPTIALLLDMKVDSIRLYFWCLHHFSTLFIWYSDLS